MLYPRDAHPVADHRLVEGEGFLRRQRAVGSRDGVPVRVAVRMPQERRQTPGEPVGDGVLEPLGLLVNLLPGVPEVLEQEGLDQPVPPHQPQGLLASALRERSPPVALVLDEPHLL